MYGPDTSAYRTGHTVCEVPSAVTAAVAQVDARLTLQPETVADDSVRTHCWAAVIGSGLAGAAAGAGRLVTHNYRNRGSKNGGSKLAL